MMEAETPLKRGCPLTGGRPISMTQSAFDRCCTARKVAAQEAAKIDDRSSVGYGEEQKRKCCGLVSLGHVCLARGLLLN